MCSASPLRSLAANLTPARGSESADRATLAVCAKAINVVVACSGHRSVLLLPKGRANLGAGHLQRPRSGASDAERGRRGSAADQFDDIQIASPLRALVHSRDRGANIAPARHCAPAALRISIRHARERGELGPGSGRRDGKCHSHDARPSRARVRARARPWSWS